MVTSSRRLYQLQTRKKQTSDPLNPLFNNITTVADKEAVFTKWSVTNSNSDLTCAVKFEAYTHYFLTCAVKFEAFKLIINYTP